MSNNRNIILTRLIDAPRARVWEALTTPDQISVWWGPAGYTTTTISMDVRVGGSWRFTLEGPNGQSWDSRQTYIEVVEGEKLVFLHGSDIDDDPHAFKQSIELTSEGDKTRITMAMTMPNFEQKAFALSFGAEELGYQTLQKLAAFIDAATPAWPDNHFTITRVFDAPRERVFKAWTERDQLAKWWGPVGLGLDILSLDLRVGGIFHYAMIPPVGDRMYGRFLYLEISPPERLVFINSFADEHGTAIRPPFSTVWPVEMLNFVQFEEDGGKTRVTLRGSAHNANDIERQTYRDGFASMTGGFGATFDALAEFLSHA